MALVGTLWPCALQRRCRDDEETVSNLDIQVEDEKAL